MQHQVRTCTHQLKFAHSFGARSLCAISGVSALCPINCVYIQLNVQADKKQADFQQILAVILIMGRDKGD